MVTSLLVEFLLHTIGWIVPLRLLFDASMRFAPTEQAPAGLRRIFLGGTLVLLAMLFSILYLTVFLAPSIELHLISHGTILVGFLLALSGARTALAALRPTPDREQPTRPIARRPFLALPAFLVLLVLAEGLASRAEPLWLLDRVLYALDLSLLAALYMSFGLWTKRETGTVASTTLSVVAAACALLAIVAHSLMIMDVSPPLKAAAQVGRGALLALGALAIYTAYRLWLARSARLQSADSVLLKPKLQLQQRLALFISIGTVLFAVGGVIMSDITRSSIQTVEQTYIQDQERVARAVARNFESLTNDLVAALSRFAAQPAVQRIRTDSLRLLFSREYPRWQQVVSFFSRVDERGILRYTYPEIASSIGADLTTQQHVQEFLRTRQITLSGVFRAVQGFNAMALYVPVFRQTSSHDSVFAGGVALLVHTDAFSARAFRNVQFLNPNPVAAINLAGSVIASSESELVGISAQQYLESVFSVPIPDDTAAHVVRRALELTTPGVLPLGVGEALTARRWVIAYPIHLDGTRVGSILLSIRQADVVSLYRSSIAQQVVWWMVITALLMLTMGCIAVVVYRWAVYLEAEVRRTVALVREREERLQTIIDTEPECVKILDAEGRVLEMNRAGLQMIEAEALTAVQGEPFYPLLVPEYRERFQQLTRNVFEERSGTLEFEIVGLRGTRRWLDTHMVPLRDAAGRVVAALGITRDITERKRLEEQRRRDQEIQSLLHKILRYSLEAPSLQEGLTQVLNLILSAPFLKLFHRGGIFLTDETQRRLVLTAQVNLPPALQSVCAFVPFGRCLCGRAAETGQIQTASCVDERHENVYPGLVPHGHFNVPLVSEGKVLGVMVLYVEHGHRFEALEFSFLRAAADVVAGIIKRGQANELLRRQFNELLAVHSMTSTLNSARSLDEINAAALRTLVDGLRADRASILLFDHNGVMRFVAWNGLSDAYRAAVEGHSPWSADAQSAEPILIEDAAVDPSVAAVRSHVLGEGIRSLAFIPLLHGGRLLGKLMLYFNTPHCFTENEIRLAQTIAAHVAFAIERKRAEETLRESEERFRTVAVQTGQLVYDYNPTTGAIVWAGAIERLTGFTDEEFQGFDIQRWEEYIHPEDRQQAIQLLEQAMRGDGRYQAEYRFRRKDGSYAVVENNGVFLFDKDRKPYRMLGAMADITERKRAEKLLRESEERFRNIFEKHRGVMLLIDPATGAIVDANQAAAEFYGYPRSTLRTMKIQDINQLNPEEVAALRQRAVKGEQNYFIFPHRLANGDVRTVEVHSSPIELQDRTVLFSIIHDITERRRAEETLRESELRFRSVWENATDGMRITNEEGTIVMVNEAFCRMVEKSREELEGQPLSVVYEPTRQHDVLRKHQERFRSRTIPPYLERELTLWNGKKMSFALSNTFLELPGRPPLSLSIFRDITERRRAETLRLRLSQVLESIASDEALPQILDRLVRAIEEYQPDMKGSVLLLDADGERLRHGSAPNLPDDYNRAIDGLRIGPRVGSCGTAAYEKRLVIVEDIQTDPLWADYRDLAAKYGLCACWSQPIIDRDGAVLGTFALYYDKPRKPTEAELELINTAANIAGIAIKRKRAEEALRQSELRYRTVVANAPVILWALDRDGQFTFSEGKGLERLGLKPGEVVGRSVFEVYRDFPEIVHNNRQALEGKTVTTVVEVAGLSFETHYAPLFGNGGEIIGAIGLAIDITERKRAEEALRASEQRYRELFEESKDAVFITTPEGRFIDINPAGVELFGYSSREEMLQVDIVKDLYVNPADREQYLRALEEQGSVKNVELRLRKRTGEEIVVLVTATAVRDAAGRVCALRGIMRDITLQRKLENEIRQAQKMESIGVLAGGIAHDFNNILGGILGYASYLKMKMTEENPFYKHLETIERSALRAADLTSKLLAFARGGKYEVKPVNLNTIVNETVVLLERSLDKTITIEVVLDPHLPTVEADAGQLHQVLMNLCVNAKDAMPGGGKLLIETTHALLDEEFARTRVGARPGHFVILSVTDTGIGMDKETLLRIFDPFFTTKEKGKGTGLGLSMVYGIVKAHNGFIRVYSELGYGSTFRVYLPASDKPTEEEQQAAADMEGGTETILVVDDEDFVRELAVEVLEGAGYKVLVAANGEEALQIYQAHSSSIDLVLLDMIMPKMNGRETFAKLREVNPRVKVVLSTGYTQNGTAREILDHGAVGFLQKPYRSHELLKKIRAALDQKRSGE